MVSSTATTVADYLAELPDDRRDVVAGVRCLVNAHLPPGYVETMGYGMIVWQIPLARYAATHNKQPLALVALAAQKQYFALYLMGCYAESTADATLRAAYARAGKKLDMGKCCLRFKRFDDLLPDAIGRCLAETTPERYIAQYASSRPNGANASRKAAAPGKDAAPKKKVTRG